MQIPSGLEVNPVVFTSVYICVCIDVHASRNPRTRVCLPDCLDAPKKQRKRVRRSGLSCSSAPLRPSVYSCSLPACKLKVCSFGFLIEFWHKCRPCSAAFFLKCQWQLRWQSLSPSYLPTEPEKQLDSKNWSSRTRTSHEYKTHRRKCPAWQRIARNYPKFLLCTFKPLQFGHSFTKQIS